MRYPSYLVHVNNNHNPKTGQFAPGDGDGDGISNDHANQRKKMTTGDKVLIGAGASLFVAGLVGLALSMVYDANHSNSGEHFVANLATEKRIAAQNRLMG